MSARLPGVGPSGKASRRRVSPCSVSRGTRAGSSVSRGTRAGSSVSRGTRAGSSVSRAGSSVSRGTRAGSRPWSLLLVLLGCHEEPPVVGYEQRLEPYVLDALPAPAGSAAWPEASGARFAGGVELLGAKRVGAGPVGPGDLVTTRAYWRVKRPAPEGYRLFAHVLDGKGRQLLNIDAVGPLREIRGGRPVLPPSSWLPGKVYVDEQSFEVPELVTGSELQIVVGLWRGDDRLELTQGASAGANRARVLAIPLRAGAAVPRLNTRVPAVTVPELGARPPPRLDGRLDEAAWKEAAFLGPFVEPDTGQVDPASPVQGSVRLLRDAEHLYLGFEVRDGKLRGGFAEDEVDPHLWTRDAVELIIDPAGDGDNLDYFEVQLNPQGLVFDSHFDDYNLPRRGQTGPFGHEDWSSQVRSAVQVSGTLDDDTDEDDGYTIEARIPWQAFARATSVPPPPGSEWRANFYVVEGNRGVGWSPILKQGNFHKATRFGRLRFP